MIWEELPNLTSNNSTSRAVCILLTKQFITNKGFSFHRNCCALRWLTWDQGWRAQWRESALTAFQRLNGTCSISGPHVWVEFLGGTLFSFGWFRTGASRLLKKAQYLNRNVSLFFLYPDLKDLHWDKPSIFLVSLLELPVSSEFKLRSFMNNEASKTLGTVVLVHFACFTLCVLQWSVKGVVSVLEVKQHLPHLLVR